ncbi:MAG: hypothetical protein JW795_19595 [Chitinivibrionales bacterium]|nr:hypothetical protein [Chitinivibrionales bacterium]
MSIQELGQVTHVLPVSPDGDTWQVEECIILHRGEVYRELTDGTRRHLQLGEFEIPDDFRPLHEPFSCQNGKRCQISPDGQQVYARIDSPGSDPDRQAVKIAKCLIF